MARTQICWSPGTQGQLPYSLASPDPWIPILCLFSEKFKGTEAIPGHPQKEMWLEHAKLILPVTSGWLMPQTLSSLSHFPLDDGLGIFSYSFHSACLLVVMWTWSCIQIPFSKRQQSRTETLLGHYHTSLPQKHIRKREEIITGMSHEISCGPMYLPLSPWSCTTPVLSVGTNITLDIMIIKILFKVKFCFWRFLRNPFNVLASLPLIHILSLLTERTSVFSWVTVDPMSRPSWPAGNA